MDIVSPRNVKGALKCQSIQALRNCTALETPLLQTPVPTRQWMWPLYRQAVREYVCLKCCGVSHESRRYYHLRRLCERCYEIVKFAICRNQRSPKKNYVAKQTCEAYIMLRVLPMSGCIRLHVNAHKEIIRETTESTQT